MATLSLRISLEGGRVTKTMQFDPSTTVFDCCRIIREKISEANAAGQSEYLLKIIDIYYLILFEFARRKQLLFLK